MKAFYGQPSETLPNLENIDVSNKRVQQKIKGGGKLFDYTEKLHAEFTKEIDFFDLKPWRSYLKDHRKGFTLEILADLMLYSGQLHSNRVLTDEGLHKFFVERKHFRQDIQRNSFVIANGILGNLFNYRRALLDIFRENRMENLPDVRDFHQRVKELELKSGKQQNSAQCNLLKSEVNIWRANEWWFIQFFQILAKTRLDTPFLKL